MYRQILLLVIFLGTTGSLWASQPTPAFQSHNAVSVSSLIDYLVADKMYKIVTPSDFHSDNEDSCITLSPLDCASGFMHISLGSQVISTLTKFFKDAQTILLLEIGTDALATHGFTLRYEQNKPEGDFYPHIYGKQEIPLAIIRSSLEVIQQADGTWKPTAHTTSFNRRTLI